MNLFKNPVLYTWTLYILLKIYIYIYIYICVCVCFMIRGRITDELFRFFLSSIQFFPNICELPQALASMSMHTKRNICLISKQATLDETSLKLVDKFTYLGSSVSSTEKDIDTRLTKAWTAIDRLSIIRKSDLTNKMKRSFFQAAVVSILLYGCTT